MNEFTRTWVFQKRTGMPGDDSGSLGFRGQRFWVKSGSCVVASICFGPRTRHMRSLTLFRRCRGNRSIHARQYDFSNQSFITWIGHFDACEEFSQIVAYGQHRFCLPMERTENDFVLGYFAVTLDRWCCGHGYFQNCPEIRNWGSFFGPHCGKILSQILKLFLGSVKQQPILSFCELYELRKGSSVDSWFNFTGEIIQPEMTPSQ